MLVLSRKEGERILIDGGITITVVETRGDKVRLGIEAPKEVTILREELYDGTNLNIPREIKTSATTPESPIQRIRQQITERDNREWFRPYHPIRGA